MVKIRMRVSGRLAVFLVLMGLAPAMSGCLAVGVGAVGAAGVGYAYYMGEVFDKFSADYPNTVAAARAALNDMNMPLVKEEAHDDTTILESRTKDWDVVRISLTPVKNTRPGEGAYTQVGVRVGFFGDGKLCNQLFGQMDTHLLPTPGNRIAPQAQPSVGPIQPVAAVGAPPQTAPPPVATN
jgi:hypothetical protein